MFNKTLNSETRDSFEENFEKMVSSDVTKNYINFIKYISNYRIRASQWAMYFRNDLITRNNHTNNYSESSIKLLKDKILKRTKAFSVVQLFDILTNLFTSYYERKLIDIVNNRSEGFTNMKYFIDENKIKNLVVTKTSNSEYEVDSCGKTYYVDYSVGNCSCPVGKHGAPCKHQYAVVTKYNLTSEHFFPIHDSQMKNKLYFIATGKLIDDDTWCDNLINQNKNTEVI